MEKNEKISLIGALLLFGFAVASYLYFVIGGSYLNAHYPYDTFLFIPQVKFSDFFDVLQMAKSRDAYLHDSAYSANVMLTANYFPFLYVIMDIVALSGSKIAFIIYLLSLITMMIYLGRNFLFINNNFRLEEKIAGFAILFFTYPFVFCIDRANVEGFIFIFVAFFLLFLLKARYKTAAVFLALASSMKLYPCILAWIFIKRKQYQACLLSGILTIILTLVGFVTFKGSFLENFNGLAREFGHFTQQYVFNAAVPTTSLFGLLKFFVGMYDKNLIDEAYAVFNIAALVMLCFTIYYILKYENILWKQFFILWSFTILFMGSSFHYKLLALILPMLLFVNERPTKFDRVYSILFAILFIPKQLHVFHQGTVLGVGEMINAVTICVMIYLIVEENFDRKTQ